MSQSRLARPSDGVRALHDAVRGARTFRFDGVLPVDALLATGEHLDFVRDDSGALRGIDVDERRFLTLDPLPDGATRLTARGIETDVRITGGGAERLVVCNGRRLEIRHDRRGRLESVTVPGSPSPVEYQWSDESCTIAPAGGPPLVRIDSVRGQMRVTLADARCGWLESIPLAPVQTMAIFDRDGNETLHCTIAEDALKRPTGRGWSDGHEDRWQRDDLGRLSAWTCVRAGAGEDFAFRYSGAGDLVDDGRARRELDDGHRVTRLVRRDGSLVSYRYDAAGRRVARRDLAGETTYDYDVLGQLTRVTTRDDDVRMTYDGLGRRVAVESSRGTWYEHRDAGGRLWSVTDARGRAVHTFLWFGGRMIARIDGDSDNAVAEGYVTDRGGTLLAVVHGDGRVERVEAPPFGALSAPMRPTLYGHTGDPAAGLIHFGARDLDPELGLFLTPDPWTGDADDPRLWDGGDPAALAQSAELPSVTIHPYALCHFDPIARTDLDGHHADGWGIFRTALLGPTWGGVLTNVSIFLFWPFDVYFDIIVGLFFVIFINPCAHFAKLPWANYHFWHMIGGAASLRQGVVALGLNGLFPRIVSGSSTAMSIGNVVWIAPEQLTELDRVRILEVWNIGGPPGPDKLPSGGATKFNDDFNKESAVAVTGADKNGKNKQVHVSRWTRGFANAVKIADPLLHTEQFVDRQLGTEANVPGTIHLFTIVGEDFPRPKTLSDPETLSVQEYIRDPAHDKKSEVEIAISPAAAVRVPTEYGAKKDDVVEVAAPKLKPPKPSVFAKVADVAHDIVPHIFFDDKIDTIFLEKALPVDFKEDLQVRRILDAAATLTSANWQAVAGDKTSVELPTPPAPPAIAKDMLLRVESGPDVAWGRVAKVELTATLTAAFDDAPAAGSNVTLLRFDVEMPATTKEAAVVHLAAAHAAVSKDDLLLVIAAEGEKAVRVTGIQGDDVTVTPSLGTFAPNQIVKVQRYVETNPKRDAAAVVTAAGTDLVVTGDRGNLLSGAAFIAYTAGGGKQFRKIDKLAKVKVTLTHESAGAGPYTLKAAIVDKKFDESGMEVSKQARYLRQTAGDLPSAFGNYPDAVIGIYPADKDVDVAVFFIKGPAPAGFDPKFRKVWEPAKVDGAEHFLLLDDLPVKEIDDAGVKKLKWQYDENWSTTSTLPVKFRVVEYRNVGAARSDVDKTTRVMLQRGEIQVPKSPEVHQPLDRSLVEHELHHAVQNSKWGPLLNALPVQGIFRDVDAGLIAAGETNRPRWLEQWFSEADKLKGQGLAFGDLFSYGGVLHFLWKYAFALPARISPDAAKALDDTKFDFWNKVFTSWQKVAGFPVELLLDAVPDPRPDMAKGDRWVAAIVKMIKNGLDLRSWTPFLGWTPLFVTPNPRSFLEQQASRAGGDNYSSILSVDDKFNATLSRVPNLRDANVARALGQSSRVMLFAQDANDRFFKPGEGNRPKPPLKYLDLGHPNTLDAPLFRIEPTALPAGSPKTLFHGDLYEDAGSNRPTEPGAPAAAAVISYTVEGPRLDPAQPRPTATFIQADTTDDVQPRLRSFVPTPPRVTSSTGFYFIPAAAGVYKITGYYRNEVYKRTGRHDFPDLLKESEFADTEHATITVNDPDVKLGDIAIAWEMPPALGSPPAGSIDLFVTELLRLSVGGASGGKWFLDIIPDAAPPLTSTPDGTAAWKIQVGQNAGNARLRLFRVYEKDDAAFDLKFEGDDAVPTLNGIRSYLVEPIWIPVRDVNLVIKDLPVFPDAAHKTNEAHTIDTPIPLAGEKSIVIVPPPGAPNLPVKKTGKSGDRGETWQIGPPAAAVAASTEYKVKVVFGAPGHSKDSNTFKLTFNP